MRSNSQAVRNPTLTPSISKKYNVSSRPTTRNQSIPHQVRQHNIKYTQNQVRPKRCPNCGSSFNPSVYNNHFKSCFRYNPEKEYESMRNDPTKKQKFRIKKIPGRKQEKEIAIKNVSRNQSNMIQKIQQPKTPVIIEKEKVQMEVQKEEFRIDDPEFIKRETGPETAMDRYGNQIENIEQIQEIKDLIIQYQQEQNPLNTNPRRVRPQPQPQPIIINPSNQNSRLRSLSSSSDQSFRQQLLQPPQPTQPQVQIRPPPPGLRNSIRRQAQNNRVAEVIQQININSISALIQRLPFLRTNEVVLQRHQSLLNLINTINLMLQSGGLPDGSYEVIKNSLQYLVSELTHILSIIVSARMGMIVLLFNGFQNHPQPIVKQGFTQQQIDTEFSPQIHSSNIQTCTVCLGDFVKYQRTITLKCKHQFHISCINEWLLKKTNCPICRKAQR